MTILMGLLLAAAFFDLRKRKIPNLLILAGAVLGMARLISCREPFLTYLPGILIPILFLFPFFSIGTLGAGDIKLFSVIGFFLPLRISMACMALGFVIAGILGVCRYIRKGCLQVRLRQLPEYFRECLRIGGITSYNPQKEGTIQETEMIGLAFPTLIAAILVTGGV